jgi:hypothetical protein
VKFTNPGAAGATFFIGVKYDPGTVVGQRAPTPSTVAYTYTTVGTSALPQTVNLVKK